MSLIHGVVKIFNQTLANRHTADLAKITVPLCMDAASTIMLVQCTEQWLHSLKQHAMLLKLDIPKSLDTIDWPFILEVLCGS